MCDNSGVDRNGIINMHLLEDFYFGYKIWPVSTHWSKLLEFNISNKQVSKREIESCACRCNKAWGPKFKSGVELISYRESGLEEERYMRRLDIASYGNNEEAIIVY